MLFMQINSFSLSNLTEFETTKHVHRLHPYRGKFIPQIPEYFLKKNFKQGDIILDPFCGSGTTLVQCAEIGIDAVGIDISEFSVFMTNVKIGSYDRKDVLNEIKKINQKVNQTIFVKTHNNSETIQAIFHEIKKIKNKSTKKFLALILSRVINVKSEKHPEAIYWWKKYSIDSLNRMIEFEKLRKSGKQLSITADSRSVDILKELEKRDKKFAIRIAKEKIRGVITSPPYVGVINYHEEHAASYELFGFKKNDCLEIGSKNSGENKQARDKYVRDMIQVFQNIKKYLVKNANLFIVVNDKFNLYPYIIIKSNLEIVEKWKRPVLNRTSDYKTPYSETIFHLKACNS